jgi:hypothetical protein
MMKINAINIADMATDVDVDMATNMYAEVYDDVAITAHLFMGQYQKWFI